MRALIEILKDTIMIQQQIYINMLQSEQRDKDIISKLDRMTKELVCA